MAASTTRSTRKTAAAKAAEDAVSAPAVEDQPAGTEARDVAPVAESPKAPEAAPLEPPAAAEDPEIAPEPTYVSPAEVIPDEENLADVILDDDTKTPPTDLDAVFAPELPYGSNLVCQLRLVERTFLGPHSQPIERLLLPEGAIVSPQIAARVMDRLQARAAAQTDEQ